ncbi:hypothetical protein HON22_06110 [Candidatus Peregrinibacteria bacterium]|jgi:hypothetical protein|nr:hypothetical protein [Candidatus Peregrinibacteria bacterium]
MQFNPATFGQNLKKSTLSKTAQEAVLNLLPKLKFEQINEIDKILKNDIKKQESIFKKAKLKADIVVKNFKKAFKISLKEQPPY